MNPPNNHVLQTLNYRLTEMMEDYWEYATRMPKERRIQHKDYYAKQLIEIFQNRVWLEQFTDIPEAMAIVKDIEEFNTKLIVHLRNLEN